MCTHSSIVICKPIDMLLSSSTKHSPQSSQCLTISPAASIEVPARRGHFERLAAAFGRRISISPGHSRSSQTSSITSVSSITSNENRTLEPVLPCPRDLPSLRLRMSNIQLGSNRVNTRHRTASWIETGTNSPSEPDSPTQASASTPFLPHMDKDKLSPCQRQMYEKLRQVNDRLMASIDGESSKSEAQV
jgi:hypothetical protein